jgi:drug/metabolite transporter (DMT)-like permease
VIGIAFALLAALCNGVSTIDRHIASTADSHRPAGLKLVGWLLRNPLWLLGSAAQVGAFVFQALALNFSPLSIVQPVLVTELVMTLILRRVWIRQQVAGAAWGGAVAACVGLTVFIVAADPRGGRPEAPASHWAVAVLACGGAAAVLTVLGRGGSPARRAVLLALAAGVMWALEAAFIKAATDVGDQAGFGALFTRWPVYAVAAGGLAGVVLEQAALQDGPLRVSQPLLVITDPIVSIALSVWLFDEYFVLNAGVLAAAAGGFFVMCAGIVVLSQTAPSDLQADPGLAESARPRSG